MEVTDSDAIALSGKSVLFIANNFKALSNAVSFLERREMQVFNAQTLKEGVEVITQRKIDFVLLSVNLENTSPAKVIPILTTNFKKETIAFAERSERNTRLMLTVLEHPHKLHAPLNGPKIIAKILQMLRREDPAIDKSNDRISVRSSKSNSDTVIRSSSVSEDIDDSVVVGSNANIKSDIIIQKGNRGTLHKATTERPLDSNDFLDANAEYRNGLDTRKDKEESNSLSAKMGGKKRPDLEDTSLDKQNARDHEGDDEDGSPVSSRRRYYPQPLPEQKSELSIPKVALGKIIPLMGADLPDAIGKVAAAQHPSAAAKIEVDLAAEAAILSSVPKKESASLGPEVKFNPVLLPMEAAVREYQIHKRICVLTIKSNVFTGYLVMAMKGRHIVPIDLVYRIRQTLAKYLKRQGEEIDSETYGFEVDIDNMEFSKWAEEFADYLSMGDPTDDEVAMAFISGDDALPFMENSVVPELCAVARKDIKPETQLDFDLYLHLPENGKFIRYGSRGGQLTADQLNRLKRGGVTHLHVLQRQKKLFQEYCGKHYIRARITDSKDVIRLSKIFKTIAV